MNIELSCEYVSLVWWILNRWRFLSHSNLHLILFFQSSFRMPLLYSSLISPFVICTSSCVPHRRSEGHVFTNFISYSYFLCHSVSQSSFSSPLALTHAITHSLISSSYSYSGLHYRGILLIYEAISHILMLILPAFPILNVQRLFLQLMSSFSS